MMRTVYNTTCKTIAPKHVRTQSSFRLELDIFSIVEKCYIVLGWIMLTRVSLWMAPLCVSIGFDFPDVIPSGLVILVNIRKWQCNFGLHIIMSTHGIFINAKYINFLWLHHTTLLPVWYKDCEYFPIAFLWFGLQHNCFCINWEFCLTDLEHAKMYKKLLKYEHISNCDPWLQGWKRIE